MDQVAMRAMHFADTEARIEAAARAMRQVWIMRRRSSSSISLGTSAPGLAGKGPADTPRQGGMPRRASSSVNGRNPVQGGPQDALRPACSSWMPAAAPASWMKSVTRRDAATWWSSHIPAQP